MKLPPLADVAMGSVSVFTSSNGGHPPEFFAERIVDQLIHVAENAPEPIRAQALAFRQSMLAVVLDGVKRAIASDRIYHLRKE